MFCAIDQPKQPLGEFFKSTRWALYGQKKSIRKYRRLIITDPLVSTWITSGLPTVDLWATRPGDSGRVIFEVKGLSDTNEIGQCRAALSQLLEYRFFYGTDEDRLCLVVDRPITDRRRAILESVGVGVVLVADSGQLKAVGQLAIAMIAGVTSGVSLSGT